MTKLARKYGEVAGADPQRALSFIADRDLRRVAEDDWNRAVGAGRSEEAKTAAIAGGSVVEAVALDLLQRLGSEQLERLKKRINKLPDDARGGSKNTKPDLAWWPAFFVLTCLGPNGLQVLTAATLEIGHKLRDWRNFIHPGKATRSAGRGLISCLLGNQGAGYSSRR